MSGRVVVVLGGGREGVWRGILGLPRKGLGVREAGWEEWVWWRGRVVVGREFGGGEEGWSLKVRVRRGEKQGGNEGVWWRGKVEVGRECEGEAGESRDRKEEHKGVGNLWRKTRK
jgi:hypothetical protein